MFTRINQFLKNTWTINVDYLPISHFDLMSDCLIIGQIQSASEHGLRRCENDLCPIYARSQEKIEWFVSFIWTLNSTRISIVCFVIFCPHFNPFLPMVFLYNPWKHQENSGFLMSVSIERYQLALSGLT